jgi:hypothetical protein
VVLGPDAGLVQHLGTEGLGRFEERVDGGSIGCRERDVRLAETVAGLPGTDPEVGHRRHAVPDHFPEVEDPNAADCRKHAVVEGRTRLDIRALERDVVQHARIMTNIVAADFGAGAIALLIAGGVAAALAAVVFAVRWATSLPDLPDAGPESSEPGPEPPAIANLLVNRCKVTTAAAAATLLDLAARRHLTLFEAGPGHYVVRVRPQQDDDLNGYEEQVLALVREKAVGGSAPLEAIELDQPQAEGWRKDFAKRVVDDAKTRGLIRRRWGRHDAVVMGALAAAALLLIAAGLYVARVEARSASNDDGFDRDSWFIVTGFAWLALMTGLASLRAVRYSATGEAAAARWLGFKRFLRNQDGFDDAPPAAVAIWNRLLAYGAGVGVARGALDGIPLEVEDPDVAWSRVDGHWRQVRVEYPMRFGYGERPLNVFAGGLVRLAFWGAIGFVVLPVLVDIVWDVVFDSLDGDDLGSEPIAAFVIGITLIVGAMAAYLVVRIADGLIRTYRGARDLRATTTVTGRVVKHHRTEQHAWFAVDPGAVEEVKASYRSDGGVPPRGATVRVVLTPHLHHVVSVETVPNGSS